MKGVPLIKLLVKRVRGEADARQLSARGPVPKPHFKLALNFLLQVIVNNYLNRIEKLNEELVNLLIEKDELQVGGFFVRVRNTFLQY